MINLVQLILNLFKSKNKSITSDKVKFGQKKTTLFAMKPHVAEMFWEEVIKRKADTAAEREAILQEFAERGLMDRVVETDRTKEQVIEDMKRNFNALDVRSIHDIDNLDQQEPEGEDSSGI